MDQVKIGKLIATLRKEKKMTHYMPDVEKLSLLSKEFGVSITELISGERLAAEDFKTAADKNLITALNNSTFALKEKMRYFKKKWLREHIATVVLCVAAWIWLMLLIAQKLRGRNAFGRDWRDGCRAVLCDTV